MLGELLFWGVVLAEDFCEGISLALYQLVSLTVRRLERNSAQVKVFSRESCYESEVEAHTWASFCWILASCFVEVLSFGGWGR